MQVVQGNLRDLRSLSNHPSRKSLARLERNLLKPHLKPLKPKFTTKGKKFNLNINLLEKDFEPLRRLGSKCKTDGYTPNQTSSHRKSFDRWIAPDPDQIKETNIELARGVLIEPESAKLSIKGGDNLFGKKGSLKIRGSKSLRSEGSLEEISKGNFLTLSEKPILKKINSQKSDLKPSDSSIVILENLDLSGKILNEKIEEETEEKGIFEGEADSEEESFIKRQYEEEKESGTKSEDEEKDIKKEISLPVQTQKEKEEKNPNLILEEKINTKKLPKEKPIENFKEKTQNEQLLPNNQIFNQSFDPNIQIEQGNSQKPISPSQNWEEYISEGQIPTELETSPINQKEEDNYDKFKKMRVETQDLDLLGKKPTTLRDEFLISLESESDELLSPEEQQFLTQTLTDPNSLDKDTKTELITNEILSYLVDDLLLDGFVLRELIKAQEDLPKGIRTNINIVKNYLQNLSIFINGTYFFI